MKCIVSKKIFEYLNFCIQLRGWGFHSVIRPLGSVKPFLGVVSYFFAGAHNSIYFVNIKLFSPTSTLTTPQKGKKRQK